MTVELAPADLVSEISPIVQEHNDWLSPEQIWQYLKDRNPELAQKVSEKVQTYQDPKRNNEVWFVSNTLYHLAKMEGFELSDVKQQPQQAGNGPWLLIRYSGLKLR